MKQQKKVLKGIRVINIDAVPALYFFRPTVVEAVHDEIWLDLKKSRKVRVPSGCQGVYGYPNLWDRLKKKLGVLRSKYARS